MPFPRKKITAFCKRWKISEFALFGSALREDFSSTSDIDALVSLEFRQTHAQIPWSHMVGMRDHLIHACDLMDWNEVWVTAPRDVPELLNKIQQMPA